MGVAAGLHVYVQLPSWCDELRLIDTARARGVLIEGASWHWSDPTTAPPALVVGYGAINESAIRDGVAILGSVFEELRHGDSSRIELPHTPKRA